jgi:hypothetical protein
MIYLHNSLSADKVEYLYLEYGVIINLSMGTLLFFIRVLETNFYSTIFCQRNIKRKSSSYTDIKNNSITENISDVSLNSDIEEKNEMFFEKDEPLTAIISRNLNLEFMCCILYGLTEIFVKPERKIRSHTEHEVEKAELTTTLIQKENSDSNIKNKNPNFKDYRRAKRHKIRYKKIFDTNIDLGKLEVEVTAFKKNKTKEVTIDTSSHISETLFFNNDTTDHDAMIIEYCGRIFIDLRRMDNIKGSDLQKYHIYLKF